MRKIVHASPIITLILILVVSLILQVNASITTKVSIDDSLFITYTFENLNSTLYDKTKANTQFNITTIPQAITRSLEQQNRKLVRWWLGPQTNIYDDANHTIQVSFFLDGSDIISFTINKTTMKRTYEVKTEWRKFQVNLTNDFSIDFAQDLAKPVAEWQKTNATTFYYENKQIGTLDMFFYFVLPSSASNIQVQGDTIFYDMPPSFEDQLLNSPFLILGVLAVALVIVLIYRKAR